MEFITAQIDRSALLHNLKTIKEHVPDANIVAVVKADAYGHGLTAVTEALQDQVQAFAVARIGEAMKLRRNGITLPIFLLEGFYNEEDLQYISKYDLHTAVHSLFQIEAIEKAKLPKPVHVWLQVDVGMHRLGCVGPDEVEVLKERLNRSDNVIKPVGMISHLSVADTIGEEEYNNTQISTFFKNAESIDGELCLTNSAGIFRWPQSHTKWVRPGIVLYGISPFDDKSAEELNLRPVMTLKSHLLSKHKVRKGNKIGYGAYFVAPRDTTIGIIGCGYGDGYPRCAPNGTPVLINGRYVPTAGHVCMDMLFVDLGENSHDQIGDEAVLWGKGLPVEKIAALCNTIPYELVCHVMPRVDFEVI